MGASCSAGKNPSIHFQVYLTLGFPALDKKMDIKEINKLRKELQTKISDTNFCWCCGRNDVDLTKHHAIPQKIKNIVMNITIPVCDNCQDVIHKDDELIGILKKMLLRK